MSRISVTHSIGDLAADLHTIARVAPGELAKVVRSNLRDGNRLAKQYARAANPPRSHAQQYPSKFLAEMTTPHRGEYGPVAEGQGQLAAILEQGEGHNAPQNNLAKSTDIIGPAFAHDVGRKADSLFWPES